MDYTLQFNLTRNEGRTWVNVLVRNATLGVSSIFNYQILSRWNPGRVAVELADGFYQMVIDCENFAGVSRFQWIMGLINTHWGGHQQLDAACMNLATMISLDAACMNLATMISLGAVQPPKPEGPEEGFSLG